MSQEQLDKPITYDVKEEAEKIPATEEKEKGVVADASGEQAKGEEVNEKKVAANPPASEGTITIGEALEAAVLTAGNKPVEWSDAAAIQAAEVRATGRTNIMPGGVAASAQSAATLNARANSDDDKTTLAVVLAGARSKLPSDKPATRKDAEGVTGAEMRNDPHLTTFPTGVAASVAAAARINQAK
ncbi:Seed maturation protein [Raphanus sativus]|uniref:Late embryogenesis abundant protein 47-like n=1 Tax=Raphanus sativus TaxID=3726 RepID=A0A6J0L8E2_RAPSA|nr:late embryogenesis abundant protein 47-like [Raphanus sativus]KAJ4877706.1 Seed maturation protein [Raphanus sativus]